MDIRQRFKRRLLIAAAAGLTVTLIATLAAWPFSYLRHGQRVTERRMYDLQTSVELYQELAETIPRDLDDLRTHNLIRDGQQDVLDAWGHPLQYTVDGDTYTITSFGRDGAPGGVGLDADLTHDTPYPPLATPTFTQKLLHPVTQSVIATCAITGMLTSILCWLLARPDWLTRPKILSLAIPIGAVVFGATIVGLILALIHVPPFHSTH